ncbi:MFS transporter [Amycolatopsis sp. FBCC-B4732]|uniref:MFS transporter n=1 Tax=Amycolatopsis sp. FBCC-B4732 TaxID=3079339 RepID=UPI001FF3E80A|nr:MFS transporter [Amycolatopsis sp. FBCC-B4732]UOX89665.1 MFS transporter [Amycolatopsis sp. FBCC-B4732]
MAGTRGGLWRHRDFRLLWAGETTSKLGSNVTTVALPLVAVLVLHAGPFTVGLLAAAAWVPWLVLGLPAGAWIDRLPHRPVMLCCDVVSAAASASVPVAAWLGVLSVGQLGVVALLTGSCGVLFGTAYRVYLPVLVAPADLPEGNAKLQGSESVAQIAGRGLAGVLAQWAGAVAGLLVDAVTFLVSAGCLAAISVREPPRPAGRPRTTLRREIADGLRWVARDRYLRSLAVFSAVANTALTGYQAINVVFFVQVAGVPPGAVGILVAAPGAGGVLGAAVAVRLARRWGSARSLLAVVVVLTPFGLLIPLAGPGPGLALPVVGGVAIGAAVVAANVLAAGFRQTYPPPSVRGRVIASGSLLANGASAVGALLAGGLGALAGPRTAVWAMLGVLAVAVVLVVAGPFRTRRDFPAAPPRVRQG